MDGLGRYSIISKEPISSIPMILTFAFRSVINTLRFVRWTIYIFTILLNKQQEKKLMAMLTIEPITQIRCPIVKQNELQWTSGNLSRWKNQYWFKWESRIHIKRSILWTYLKSGVFFEPDNNVQFYKNITKKNPMKLHIQNQMETNHSFKFVYAL